MGIFIKSGFWKKEGIAPKGWLNLDNYFAPKTGGGGSVSIPATSYATNADAVIALGVGVLYKSTTLINGSPIILLTV